MEYTQNYQLPLWDKEDSVLRTDFNENNQKIDAALRELAAKDRTEVLGHYAIDTESLALDIDVSGIDLSQYTALEVQFSRLTCDASFNLICYLNHIKGYYCNQANSIYVDSLAALSSSQIKSGEYVLSGKLMIYMNGPALYGYYINHTETVYDGKYLFRYNNNDWGLHYRFLLPAEFTSINIEVGSAAPTGDILLIGHCF